jgi:sugar phosphate isomerase/epimerase
MTRRALLASLSALAARYSRAAEKLPANRNVKWALGSNLWNYFPRVPFTDILDVMKDTGFIGIRVTQFPQILNTYKITQAEMEREVSKRGLHVITISFNGAAHDASRRGEVLDNAKRAMEFLKGFGADKLVVFSPNRNVMTGDAAAKETLFKNMCQCYNELGALAQSMGFRAGLHNHMGQIVQDTDELDRCMAMTDPKLFWLSPDTAHLYLAGVDVVKALDKYRTRLMMADYKDARHVSEKLQDNIFDLGDGEVDFPGCHRVLKSIHFDGWLCVDLDTARQGPRASYERCGKYIVEKLEPIYV